MLFLSDFHRDKQTFKQLLFMTRNTKSALRRSGARHEHTIRMFKFNTAINKKAFRIIREGFVGCCVAGDFDRIATWIGDLILYIDAWPRRRLLS